MKKVFNLSIILAVLAAAFTFSSCGKDKEDSAQITITFNQSGTFGEGDAVTGTISSPDEDLTKVVILKDGNAVKTITSFKELPIMKGTDGKYTIFIDGLTPGDYNLRAESKTGESSKGFSISGSSTNPTTTPLDAAVDFSWIRDQGAVGTGLGEYGLAWTSNTATNAIVKLDAATKLVQLTSAQWTSITTKEALKDAVDAGTSIADYRGIELNKTASYDVVLGVNKGGTYYIIHITNFTNFNYTGTANYKYTISGQSKK